MSSARKSKSGHRIERGNAGASSRAAVGRSTEQAAWGHRRTRSDHARETGEDYVELIEQLIRESGEARAVDIARYLGVTHATVSKTIARLIEEGLVSSAPYRAIFLTPEGRKMAEEVRRRHQSVLDFLLALGVSRGDAEADAEGIEHHISAQTLEAMRRFVRNRDP